MGNLADTALPAGKTSPGPRTARPVRVAAYLAPHLFWFYRFLSRHISRRLGLRLELMEGISYRELGQADFAFVCSLPYVEQEHLLEPLAAPILRGRRYESRPIYFSDVIVHRHSDIKSFADLRGRSWAFNEKHSQSGYGITRDHLLRMGETRGFFGRVVEAGWHERALRLVAAGEVDASAIDSHVLATYLRAHPALHRRLRIIHTLGPSPIQPLVAGRHVPRRLTRAFQTALVQVHRDPAFHPILTRAMVKRFTSVNAATYDPIRTMRAAALAKGFWELR